MGKNVKMSVLLIFIKFTNTPGYQKQQTLNLAHEIFQMVIPFYSLDQKSGRCH